MNFIAEETRVDDGISLWVYTWSNTPFPMQRVGFASRDYN